MRCEIPPNLGILLFFWTFESSKFSSIPYLIYYGTVRSAGKNYGKKYALLEVTSLPQYLGGMLLFHHGRNGYSEAIKRPTFLDLRGLFSFHQLQAFPSIS
jgi:hypothetical protein